MSLAGCQINQLISIFTSKNVWKFLIRIQLTKSHPKIIRGVNPPYLMPIRVKCQHQECGFLYFYLSNFWTSSLNFQNCHYSNRVLNARKKVNFFSQFFATCYLPTLLLDSQSGFSCYLCNPSFVDGVVKSFSPCVTRKKNNCPHFFCH